MDAAREGGGGSHRFRSEPHPALRSSVVEYWAIARALGVLGGSTITPDCSGELICCVDELFAVDGTGRERLPICIVVVLLDGPVRLEAPGVVRCMAARLRPWSVGVLLAACPDNSMRGWRDAGRILGSSLAEIGDLVARGDWERSAAVLDRVLLELLGRSESSATGGELVGPFLEDDRCRTATVAELREVSTRQIERQVRRLTGRSPKQLAGLARFQRARDALWVDPCLDLAWLALEVGYSDQPHLTREFRRYAGQTPAQFARAMAERRRPRAQDVAIVQERPAADQ